MDSGILSQRSRNAIGLAAKSARKRGHKRIGDDELVIALLQENGLASRILNKSGLSVRQLQFYLYRPNANNALLYRGKVVLSLRAKLIFRYAGAAAFGFGDTEVEPEHVLHGLLCLWQQNDYYLPQTLGIDSESLQWEVMTVLAKKAREPEPPVIIVQASNKRRRPTSRSLIMEQYSRN